MKKIFTLAALGLMASFGATAQITLDGRVMANEIGTGAGKYQSIGVYDQAHSFGPWGLKEAYAASDSQFLYVFVKGAVERHANGGADGNSLQVYFDVPSVAGAPACQTLPLALATADPTSFIGMAAKMEMETDAAIAIRYNNDVPYLELADYRPATLHSEILGSLDETGTQFDFLPGNAAGAAWQASPTDITDNTDEGLEFRIALAAYGINQGDIVHMFVMQNNHDGTYISADIIPEDPNGTGAQIGTNPDFCNNASGISGLGGTQYASYQIGTGVVSGIKKVDASAFNLSVAPNPVSGQDAVVSFELAKPEAGSVIVTDLLGRTVATLAKGTLPAGSQHLSLKASGLAAGQYLVKLQTANTVATRKVSVQ